MDHFIGHERASQNRQPSQTQYATQSSNICIHFTCKTIPYIYIYHLFKGTTVLYIFTLISLRKANRMRIFNKKAKQDCYKETKKKTERNCVHRDTVLQISICMLTVRQSSKLVKLLLLLHWNEPAPWGCIRFTFRVTINKMTKFWPAIPWCHQGFFCDKLLPPWFWNGSFTETEQNSRPVCQKEYNKIQKRRVLNDPQSLFRTRKAKKEVTMGL